MRFSIWSQLIVSCACVAALGCSSATTDSPADSRGGAGNAGSNGGMGGSGASSAGGAFGGGAGAASGGAGTAGAAQGGTGGSDDLGGGAPTAGSGGVNTGGGILGPTGLVHPGILVNKDMLEFVKGKIASGAEPWKSALSHASSNNMGSLSYTAHPHDNVQCGPSSNPDIGCTDEKNDVIAAYTHALIWYHTGDQKHADKAIQIMNAWSSTLKKHTFDNEQLQASWAAEIFPRAAEIIRYSNAGWSEADIKQFSTMLKTAYLPEVVNGSTRTGNWDTSAIEADMNIAIFDDDMENFQNAVKLWRARTPAYIYLSSDGPLPVQPPRESPRSDSDLKGYWWSPTKFIDGITQESCRDQPGGGTQGFGHAQYGVAAIINAAETARIQGVDLLQEERARLSAMLEFHSKYLNGASTSGLCAKTIENVGPDPMWEIGYNEYANVLGGSLPETQKLVKSIRPTDATHHMAWETLTHGDIANAGF